MTHFEKNENDEKNDLIDREREFPEDRANEKKDFEPFKVHEPAHKEHHKPVHHEHKAHHGHKSEKKPRKKLKVSFWKVSTVVLLALLILLNYSNFIGGGLSEEEISANTINYINNNLLQAGDEAQLVSATKEGDLYNLKLNIAGQEIDSYVTLDGKLLFPQVIKMDESLLTDTTDSSAAPVTETPKSDNPKVELFIWSYCPYGVQAQGPLSEVVSLLGADADFEAVLYYDGHGAYETQQNKIQACIQEIAQDKYWDYATGFVDNIYPKCGASRDIDCDKTESVKLMKSLGINDVNVMSCVQEKGTDLIAEHSNRAQAYGVTGSPSLMINGVKVNTERNAEAYKAAICDAFNNAPADCLTTLDASSATAAGNC